MAPRSLSNGTWSSSVDGAGVDWIRVGCWGTPAVNPSTRVLAWLLWCRKKEPMGLKGEWQSSEKS